MQLFYNEDLNETSQRFVFSKEESRHIVRVLRKGTGDTLNITNGKGGLFEAEILGAGLKSVEAQIIHYQQEPDPVYRLHLAVAPTKSMDRFEWFLEKATEIGIAEITPILCTNSERKTLKKERLERIVLSALKQSLKTHRPVINDLLSFDEFLKTTTSSSKYIAHCGDGHQQSLQSVAKGAQNPVIMIGPEGDFSVKEIETSLTEGFIPVTLGTSRLRTETAALVACHTIALVNEQSI
jgi:16S rRNA (uracil1498-N3)-methyltransferase